MDGSGSGAARCSSGSIVWVRRRNGSWWPAKILGPEELSHSHLTSPRAGTPVKLLGREDASVDWYNLEKSKRVKAFRCVEFSDFIEKVESSGSQSHAVPSQKREKYASREDAILHALELEKQQLRKQEGPHVDMANGLTVNKSSVTFQKGFLVPPGGGTTHGGGELPPQVSKRLQEVASARADEKIYRQNHLNDSGEEDEKGVPRMGVLQQYFGIAPPPPNRKLPSSVAMNGCYGKPKTNDVSVGGFLSMRNLSYLNGEEMGVTSCRKKRSRCMYLLPEEDDSNGFMDDKENHHLRSMMNLQISPSSTSGGEGGNICLARDGNAASELSGEELDGGGSSDYYLAESDFDSTETERDTNEETSSLSEDLSPMAMHNKAQEEEEEEDHGSTIISSSEEEDPEGPMGTKSPLLAQNRSSASHAAAISKWQLKGKRNFRNLTTRRRLPLDPPCGKNLIGSSNHHQYMHSTVDGREISFAQKWRSSHVHIVSDLHKRPVEIDANEEDLESQFFASNPGIAATPRGQQLWTTPNREEEMNKLRGGAQYVTGGRQHHWGRRRREMLFEVDLKVQVSYPKERAPLVAMKSELNGNSIIGHSIETEAIEGGSSYRVLLPNQESLCESSSSSRSMVLPQTWRTSRRRTARFRFPHPNPNAVAFKCDEDPR